MPLGDMEGIASGSLVVASGKTLRVNVGGRINWKSNRWFRKSNRWKGTNKN